MIKPEVNARPYDPYSAMKDKLAAVFSDDYPCMISLHLVVLFLNRLYGYLFQQREGGGHG
jgi:hypothetical protein